MLAINNLSITLNAGSALQRPILQDLSLHVDKGEFVVIIGGNGAGKSTLFQAIGGRLKPTQGHIFLEGQDLQTVPLRTQAAWVSKVMQDPTANTLGEMTLFENLAYAYKRGQRRWLTPYTTRARRDLFKQKLVLLEMGLEHRLDDFVSHLSGGQRQALALIVGLLVESKILLLDEITAALDPKTAEKVVKIAQHLVVTEKRTALMITHNMSHALQYGDRTLLLGRRKDQARIF